MCRVVASSVACLGLVLAAAVCAIVSFFFLCGKSSLCVVGGGQVQICPLFAVQLCVPTPTGWPAEKDRPEQTDSFLLSHLSRGQTTNLTTPTTDRHESAETKSREPHMSHESYNLSFFALTHAVFLALLTWRRKAQKNKDTPDAEAKIAKAHKRKRKGKTGGLWCETNGKGDRSVVLVFFFYVPLAGWILRQLGDAPQEGKGKGLPVSATNACHRCC